MGLNSILCIIYNYYLHIKRNIAPGFSLKIKIFLFHTPESSSFINIISYTYYIFLLFFLSELNEFLNAQTFIFLWKIELDRKVKLRALWQLALQFYNKYIE